MQSASVRGVGGVALIYGIPTIAVFTCTLLLHFSLHPRVIELIPVLIDSTVKRSF